MFIVFNSVKESQSFTGFTIIYTVEIVTCAIHMTLNLPRNQMWNFSCEFHISRETIRVNEQNVPQV